MESSASIPHNTHPNTSLCSKAAVTFIGLASITGIVIGAIGLATSGGATYSALLGSSAAVLVLDVALIVALYKRNREDSPEPQLISEKPQPTPEKFQEEFNTLLWRYNALVRISSGCGFRSQVWVDEKWKELREFLKLHPEFKDQAPYLMILEMGLQES